MLSVMSSQLPETNFVTVDETDETFRDDKEETEEEDGTMHARVAWQEWLRKGVHYLMHMEPQGNVLPEVGTRCIVMAGNAGQDCGQMAKVTDQKIQMVGIKYRESNRRRLEYKVKRPSSLIMLEIGLTVKQDIHGPYGYVWKSRRL
jgi:hypothetical protein